jgi:Dolichyl-phosphate-mannose--protein O-mannosyl transferase
VFVIVGLLAQYLPWILVPRGTYIYHYFASIPFLITAAGLCFDMPGRKARTAAKAVAAAFIIAAAVFFVILFPYASGLAVSRGWLDIGRSILRIWY